ncbi:MAG: aminotransferase class III-fold pyridoxal phosphate-dependent enzyme [Desulfobacterales bacterium]|nr:aminotransferase class III-fold pyridoxal phosphate-dependent enzyme [Desulfobacterales bacterium]
MKRNLEKSLDMQNRAKSRIPGMTQLLSKRPDMFAPGVWPGYYSKAKGVEVWDLDGNRYTDMSIAGIGANVLGYADPDVDEAVKRAIDNGTSCSLNCAEEVELADLLCEIHPWAEKVRYARTGGESMAVAVRIARAYTGKDKIAFCGYHGWHDWYLAANLKSDMLGNHLLPGLDPTGVPKGLTGTALPFRYNHIEELQDIVVHNRGELAAIVMEPIRSDQPIPGFLEGIRAIADEIEAVLIFDEISAGFRINTGGAHLVFGVMPDIAVFSKAIGNGYPVAAIIGVDKVMDAAQKTFISSTNWTERTGTVAAIACIKKHKDMDVSSHLISMGEKVQQGWKGIALKVGLNIKVGGIPPLSHFVFEYDNSLEMKALFVQLMLEHEFLSTNLFYSMFAHTSQYVDQYLQAVEDVFSFIAHAQQAGNLKQQLKGAPAGVGFKRLA